MEYGRMMDSQRRKMFSNGSKPYRSQTTSTLPAPASKMDLAQPYAQRALTFGKHYAVLNLDLMEVLIDAIKDTEEGQAFVSNCSRWNVAVHEKPVQPLTIFTSLYFSDTEHELAERGPFTTLVKSHGSFARGSREVQISREFAIGANDIFLQKTRWYAGAGNNLEQTLETHNIDTVVISGLSLSGVVMSTVYRLFDLDYNIYVISDNVLELPTKHNEIVSKVMLEVLLSKMNLNAISIDEALEALKRS